MSSLELSSDDIFSREFKPKILAHSTIFQKNPTSMLNLKNSIKFNLMERTNIWGKSSGPKSSGR